MALDSKICKSCANEHGDVNDCHVEFVMGFCDWCEERHLVTDSYYFFYET